MATIGTIAMVVGAAAAIGGTVAGVYYGSKGIDQAEKSAELAKDQYKETKKTQLYNTKLQTLAMAREYGKAKHEVAQAKKAHKAASLKLRDINNAEPIETDPRGMRNMGRPGALV